MGKFIFIIVICFSCSSNYKMKDANFELVIEVTKSYKYDFINGIYTIFYIDKSPEEIKFQLSEDEKNSIQEKYYELNLNKLPNDINIDGTCMNMPKLYTVIQIKTTNTLQKIQIEMGCDKFNILKTGRAKRINNFINYVYQILNSRPEIKNSPKSNVDYI